LSFSTLAAWLNRVKTRLKPGQRRLQQAAPSAFFLETAFAASSLPFPNARFFVKNGPVAKYRWNPKAPRSPKAPFPARLKFKKRRRTPRYRGALTGFLALAERGRPGFRKYHAFDTLSSFFLKKNIFFPCKAFGNTPLAR